MTVKILEVRGCYQCHYLRRFNAFLYECLIKEGIVMNGLKIYGISKECPLPDIKED